MRLDAFKDKGDYEGLLTLAKEYYDGNGINEEYTYSSPIQNRGDNLLIEDKDFAVVYNGSVGGTYEVMLKFTEKEVRDHIRRYGIEHAGDRPRKNNTLFLSVLLFALHQCSAPIPVQSYPPFG